MDLLNRPTTSGPHDSLPSVPSFTVTSHELVDGASMPHSVTEVGGSISPQLYWEGFPPRIRSFTLTYFDPDTPTPLRWWHWVILNLAPEQTSLSQETGKSDLEFDGAAFHIHVDYGGSGYFGAAPPKGDRPRRHISAVHTLNFNTLGLDDEATPVACAAQMLSHTTARARITVTHEVPWTHSVRLDSNSLAFDETGQDGSILHLIFFEPEIPGSSGTAVRLSACIGAMFHLVEPLSFDMDNTKLRRAGLDHHDLAHVVVHPDLDSTLAKVPGKVWAFTGHVKYTFTDMEYPDSDGLLFDRESVGLSEEALSHPRVNAHIRIRMTEGVRSLNLANSASIALYHAWDSFESPGEV